MAIYMKYGKIDCAVASAGFAKWVKLNPSDCGDGGGAARGSTCEPTLSEVTVTKMTDAPSPKLMPEWIAGKLDNKVTVKFTTKGKVETFTTCKFTDRGVGGYSLDSNGATPEASISLTFTKITNVFSGRNPDISGRPETVGHNVTQTRTI